MCSACESMRVGVPAPPPPGGSSRTHVALDGEDLGSQLLDAHVQVRDLAAAAVEAVPKLSGAGSPLLQLEGAEEVLVRGHSLCPSRFPLCLAPCCSFFSHSPAPPPSLQPPLQASLSFLPPSPVLTKSSCPRLSPMGCAHTWPGIAGSSNTVELLEGADLPRSRHPSGPSTVLGSQVLYTGL